MRFYKPIRYLNNSYVSDYEGELGRVLAKSNFTRDLEHDLVIIPIHLKRSSVIKSLKQSMYALLKYIATT